MKEANVYELTPGEGELPDELGLGIGIKGKRKSSIFSEKDFL